MSNFRITDHKGFRITFANGWEVSVQFGAFNYADHYDSFDSEAARKAEFWSSATAETALINPDGKFVNFPLGTEGNEVQGYCSPEHVADLIAYARAQ